MYIDEITIKQTARCYADHNYTVQAVADADMTEILPYLNTVFANANFKRKGAVLSFQQGDNKFTLQEKNIVLTKLVNPTDAFEKLDWLKDTINETYEKRASILPNYEEGQEVTMLEIYQLLPKKNCGECGELTCMAFAAKLYSKAEETHKCRPLHGDEKYRSLKLKMQELIML